MRYGIDELQRMSLDELLDMRLTPDEITDIMGDPWYEDSINEEVQDFTIRHPWRDTWKR